MNENLKLVSGNGLNEELWEIMTFPLPDQTWKYEEPDARVTALEDGGIEIEVQQFTRRGLPGINPTDTGKHFYMSKKGFPIPEGGKAKLSVEMAALSINTDGENYQYGFANTILQDQDNFLIYDTITTGERIYAIYEKLLVPGKVSAEEAFTRFTESPFVTADTNPLFWYHHAIELDLAERRIVWTIEGKEIHRIEGLTQLPKELHIGFGLFTLKPYVNGESASIIGQGMLGKWRNLHFETTEK